MEAGRFSAVADTRESLAREKPKWVSVMENGERWMKLES
jgi:hypothetical protein